MTVKDLCAGIAWLVFSFGLLAGADVLSAILGG